MVGELRTWRTVPSNVLPGNASTVNVAFMPSVEPADVALGDRGVDLHARERSSAIVNSVGAEHDDCDGLADRRPRATARRRRSASRSSRTPRLVFACARFAYAWLTLAFDADERGLRGVARDLEALDRGAGDQLLVLEALLALVLAVRVVERDLRLLLVRDREVVRRLLLIDLRLQQAVVELRDDLALLDLIVEVGVQLDDAAGDLRADLHRACAPTACRSR